MYTIDTSVWVNATEPGEIDHAVSRAFVRETAARALPLIQPTLVLVEVAAAVGRLRGERRSTRITRLVAHWSATTFRDLDRALADSAAMLARRHRLRGADAVYAAVTQQYGTTLVSRDREHLTRLVGIVPVLHPAAALAALMAQPPIP
jgi:predicted nucleic acid-binding protein